MANASTVRRWGEPCRDLTTKRGDDTARDKLEAAFWDALAEGSYEGISVVGLCRSAGVNKNTFYYHFDNIDELARAAAESLVETQFIYTVIEAIRGDAQTSRLPLEERVLDAPGSGMPPGR